MVPSQESHQVLLSPSPCLPACPCRYLHSEAQCYGCGSPSACWLSCARTSGPCLPSCPCWPQPWHTAMLWSWCPAWPVPCWPWSSARYTAFLPVQPCVQQPEPCPQDLQGGTLQPSLRIHASPVPTRAPPAPCLPGTFRPLLTPALSPPPGDGHPAPCGPGERGDRRPGPPDPLPGPAPGRAGPVVFRICPGTLCPSSVWEAQVTVRSCSEALPWGPFMTRSVLPSA